jgi:hypothetical protein
MIKDLTNKSVKHIKECNSLFEVNIHNKKALSEKAINKNSFLEYSLINSFDNNNIQFLDDDKEISYLTSSKSSSLICYNKLSTKSAGFYCKKSSSNLLNFTDYSIICTKKDVKIKFTEDIKESTQISCKEDTYESYVIKCLKQIKYFVPFFQSESYINQVMSIKNKIKLITNIDDRKIICFDLDETLIFSEAIDEYTPIDEKYDFILNEYKLGVIIRPGAKELLSYCKKYNLFVYLFTAAELKYAETIINQSGLVLYIDQVMARDECVKYKFNDNDVYFKDISILSREDTIIVDNLIVSFASNLKNGVFVNSYDGSNNDNELYELKDYIDHLYCDSVASPVNKNEKFFCFQSIFNSLA